MTHEDISLVSIINAMTDSHKGGRNMKKSFMRLLILLTLCSILPMLPVTAAEKQINILTPSAFYLCSDNAKITQGSGILETSIQDPYLRIYSTSFEQGYNSEWYVSNPAQFNELLSGGGTHALKLSEVPMFSVDGIIYRKFNLDANEQANARYISIGIVKIYIGGTDQYHAYSTATWNFQTPSPATLVWDLDAACNEGQDGAYIAVDTGIEAGSGVSDLSLWIPQSKFSDYPECNYGSSICNKWVYMFARLGEPANGVGGIDLRSDDGFEEWSVETYQQMLRPVDGLKTQEFLKGTHEAIDIAGSYSGEIAQRQIYAPASGTVVYNDDLWPCGNGLQIKHDRSIARLDGIIASDVATSYCHLFEKPPLKIGDYVNRGDPIAKVGNTGNSYMKSYHLHFIVWEKGEEVDPELFVQYDWRPGFETSTNCPVDLLITNPDGLSVGKNLNELGDSATYSEYDFNGDGKLEDRIWIFNPLLGNYLINVIPEPTALPIDTFSLRVSSNGESLTISNNVAIKDITAKPYEIQVQQNGDIIVIQNTPPDLTNPGDKSIFEGKTLSLNLIATDPDNDPLTYSFSSNSPLSGAILTGNTFSWAPGTGSAGSYSVTFKATDTGGLSDEETITITVILPVNIDIKPGSCPNAFNRNEPGVLPVAIVGTTALDVRTIDQTSITLNGVKATKWEYKDSATPYSGTTSCGCNVLSRDGKMDLILYFTVNDVTKALPVTANKNDMVSLTLAGKLKTGILIEGKDCIKIAK